MAIPRVIKTPNTLNLGSFHSFSFPEILHRLHATHLKSIFLKMNISDFKSVYINRSKSYESRCIESWIIANLSDLSESSTVEVVRAMVYYGFLIFGLRQQEPLKAQQINNPSLIFQNKSFGTNWSKTLGWKSTVESLVCLESLKPLTHIPHFNSEHPVNT